MDWQLIECERHGIEPDGPSSRWSSPLAESYYYATERIEQLQAIVDKLRKTEDGVPAVDGMEVWCNGLVRYRNGAQLRLRASPQRLRLTLEGDFEFVGLSFSTRKAAQAAGGE